MFPTLSAFLAHELVRLRRTKKEFLLLHHLCFAQVMQQQEKRYASATRENARENGASHRDGRLTLSKPKINNDELNAKRKLIHTAKLPLYLRRVLCIKACIVE